MDAAVGRLVQVLRDTGLLDNTLVRTIDGGYCCCCCCYCCYCCCCCLSVWSKSILSRLFSLLTMGLGVYRRAKARFSINIFISHFVKEKLLNWKGGSSGLFKCGKGTTYEVTSAQDHKHIICRKCHKTMMINDHKSCQEIDCIEGKHLLLDEFVVLRSFLIVWLS